MQPVALASAAHDEQIAFTGHEHHVVGAGPSWNAFDMTRIAGPWAQYEWAPCTKHNDGDQRVVEPFHLAVAVQPLEVVAVAVEQPRDAGERDSVARLEVKGGLPNHVSASAWWKAGTEALFGDISVVPKYL